MINKTIIFDNISELQKQESLAADSQTLIQIFCANNNLEEIKEIQYYFATIFPEATILGTTTDGALHNADIYIASKHVATFTKFEKTTLKSILVEHDDSVQMSHTTGEKLLKQIIDSNSKVLLSFADGINTNGEEFLKGISSVDSQIIVSGGLAGDNGELKKTYVFNNESITDSGAVGVTLNSDALNVFTHYSFDWTPIGKKLTITKSVKNRVYEIDGMPAVDIYAKYMGKELAQNLPQIGIEFPLIFEKDGVNIGRAVLFKHNDGSLTFAGNLQEGEKVRFGVGNVNNLLKSGDYQIDKIFNNIQFQPEAVFVYSCMARRRFMEKYIEYELEGLSTLGDLSGFFTYGEFFHNQKRDLLNESITLLVLSENNKIMESIKRKNIECRNDFAVSTEYALANLANSVSQELAELNSELEQRIQRSADFIYKQAYFDKLTGVPNRLSLLQRIDECVGETVFLVNIDDFTTINDFYGHAIGDIVLVKMSKYLQEFTENEGMELFKLPSDEFAVISNVEQIYQDIERIIKKLIIFIEKKEFLVNDQAIHISVTISAAYINEKNTGLANADMVLKAAKKAHKPYLVFNKSLELSKKYESNLKMANEIKRAIESDDIIPYYQPIFNIKTGEVEKYEALVRLRKSDGKILSPYFFLAISEKIKLYPRITEIMVEKTFAFFAKNGLKFSINLSFSDIFSEKMREFIFEKIREYNIAKQLTIEILETQEYSNEDIVSEFTKEVYESGAYIAIDDFGSGFANFQYMTNISSDYMKIDGSLIKNIHQDQNSRLIVETIVIFAKKLGKKVVAEFVHSKEVFDVIKEIGIEYAQGYYLGEPKESVI
ncbi:bifunctional diguanylate cyclase/phosphodiesterase [Sulfurimonas autotrophica]|uniref:Diguanylate cyclase/phosphodiesterase n=1 Tax=Sulfurimonas autotrophica (strain ATCC BAA-671 / DSM 16294 / JCM 11897 / OK10) TaxID=563040 RepID=E0UPI0_SULAO|nr:EAL domain-containing protein [Sulfurimonas autotrophica]ADN09710.1 diguanylate cyclase/phosphodiesterase [Sulfurimonas autotrophica DSM 16294]